MTFFNNFLLYLFIDFFSTWTTLLYTYNILWSWDKRSATSSTTNYYYLMVRWLCPSILWEPSLMLGVPTPEKHLTTQLWECVVSAWSRSLYTAAQVLVYIQQGLLKKPCLCIRSLPKGPLSRALCRCLRPHIGHHI